MSFTKILSMGTSLIDPRTCAADYAELETKHDKLDSRFAAWIRSSKRHLNHLYSGSTPESEDMYRDTREYLEMTLDQVHEYSAAIQHYFARYAIISESKALTVDDTGSDSEVESCIASTRQARKQFGFRARMRWAAMDKRHLKQLLRDYEIFLAELDAIARDSQRFSRSARREKAKSRVRRRYVIATLEPILEDDEE